MNVPTSVVNEVKTWLNSKHIKVPVDWVEACIDFLKRELQVQYEKGSLQKLKNCVYEQWLVSDLAEIGVPSLPSDLSVTQKTTLQGVYALQINGIRDVGKSAYSQLKQCDGIKNENAEVSAAPKPFVPEWEAKPTRMLMMNLTDGVNYVQGMEYKPISYLSVDLPAGVKVLIQGPIDCRFGVILLMPERITVLGGEVETLSEQYSKQEVLRDALQLRNENDEATAETGPYESNHSRSARNQNNPVQNTRSAPVQHRIHQQTSSGISSHSSVAAGCPTYPLSRPQISNMHHDENFEGFKSTEDLDFDDFEDDDDAFMKSIDYNALEKIEKESLSPVLPANDDFDISEDEDVYLEVMAHQENTMFDKARPVITLSEEPKKSEPVVNKVSAPTQSSPSCVRTSKLSTPESFSSINQRASFTPSVSPSNSKKTFTSNTVSSLNHPTFPSSNTLPSFCDKQKSPQGPAESSPFSCLSSVLKTLDPCSEFTVTIKAHVTAVLSRLECSATSGWQLTAKLDDGTGVIEASIDDKVLEKFVGIPAKEMVVLQTQARSNAEVRNKVLEAITKCKIKLQSLNCLMEVKFSPQLPKPNVIKCVL